MNAPRFGHGLRLFGSLAALVAAAWQLSLLGRIFLGRVRYPWDVEWLESSVLYQAYRVMSGLPTYAPPKDGYLPVMHPFGYPWLLGMLGKVVGLGYPMARALSLGCFIAAAALVVRALVRHQEGRLEGWALGAFAVGAAAAGVPLFEGFYDLVREDMLAMLLSVLAAALVDGPPKMSRRRIAVVALAITGVVYTRLPYVFFPAWVVAFVLARHRRTGVELAITAAAFCGVVLVGLLFTSKGWYWLYTVSLVQEHRVVSERFLRALEAVIRFAPFLAAIPPSMIALAVSRRLSAGAVLWAGMLFAALPAGLLPFAKVGGFANDFLPIAFLIGPATAFVASDVIVALRRRPTLSLVVPAALFGAGALFLAIRSYDHRRYIPTPDHFRRAARLNAKVASLKGGVLSPRHPFLPAQNGHSTLEWSEMPYLDMAWAGYTDLKLGSYIDRAHARYAVVTGGETALTQRELASRYQLEGPIGDAPATIIGSHSQLRHLLRIQDSEHGARVLFDFEKGLSGFTQIGDAFQIVPARGVHGVVGSSLLTSQNAQRGDAGKGTLLSPAFVIDRPHLAMRVAGSKGGTRVELRIDGRTERRASSIFDAGDILLRVVWDVAALRGRVAQIAFVDTEAGSGGRLLVDHVVLY